jgi:lysophospholipase L1-like esterase
VEGVDFSADVASHIVISFVASTTPEEQKTLWIDDLSVKEEASAQVPGGDFATLAAKCPLPAVVPPFKDGDVVACAGDSITHNGKYHRYLALFYATRFPDRKVTIWNAGISGNVAQDVIDRYQGDIAWRKPTILTVMLGTNDIGGPAYSKTAKPDDLKPQIDRVLARYQTDISKIVELARTAGSRVVLIAPPPYDQTADIPAANAFGRNDVLPTLIGNLSAYASSQGIPLVNDFALLQYLTSTRQQVSGTFTLNGDDRVHPSDVGHLAIAYAFLKSQGISPFVSKINIDAATNQATAQDATVDKLATSGREMTFECTEKALPYPVEWRAALATRLVPFQDDLNQELLSIGGLAGGRYKLSIDGAAIATFDAKELAAGVNLSVLQNTPQYKQAMLVAALNDRRADKELGLRSVVFLESDMRKAKVDPADPVAAKKFLDGLWNWRRAVVPLYNQTKPRLAETLTEIQSLQEEMYAAAKPVRRAYRVSPVE